MPSLASNNDRFISFERPEDIPANTKYKCRRRQWQRRGWLQSAVSASWPSMSTYFLTKLANIMHHDLGDRGKSWSISMLLLYCAG